VANCPKAPSLPDACQNLDDLLIDSAARPFVRRARPSAHGFSLGRAIAGEHVVLDVTFTDTPIRGVCACACASPLAAPRLPVLVILVHCRHDLPSRQPRR